MPLENSVGMTRSGRCSLPGLSRAPFSIRVPASLQTFLVTPWPQRVCVASLTSLQVPTLPGAQPESSDRGGLDHQQGTPKGRGSASQWKTTCGILPWCFFKVQEIKGQTQRGNA